jgi:N-methylhydantoinase A
VLAGLDRRCDAAMQGEGVPSGAATARHFADICYIGQGYHLEIALRDEGPDPLAALYRDFLAAHDRVYGHAAGVPARLVNLRAVHRVAPLPLSTAPPPHLAPRQQEAKSRRVLIDPALGPETAAVYERATLAEGQGFDGPAIVEQPDTTTLVPRGWRCRVAAGGILAMSPS